MSATTPNSPFRELVLFRLREYYRNPAPFVWGIAFPMLLTAVLAFAFQDQHDTGLSVAVVDGPDATEWVERLSKVEGLSVSRLAPDAATSALRRGRVDSLVFPESPPRVRFNSGFGSSRTAKTLVHEALERSAGRRDLLEPTFEDVDGPGLRYVDFLLPGLLGLSLISSSVASLAYPLVILRKQRVLKRLKATPLSRTQFLLSFVVVRFLLAAIQTGFFLGLAAALDVQMASGMGPIAAFALIGAISGTGIGLLVASRTEEPMVAGSLENLIVIPMMLLSGVFFPASNFPDWVQPVIQLLPVTALNDGLRALFNEGVPIIQLLDEAAIVGVWGVLASVIAIRLFRWS